MECLARYIADSLSNSNQSCVVSGTVLLHQRERNTYFRGPFSTTINHNIELADIHLTS